MVQPEPQPDRPAIDVVREALDLIARGESPAHLQSPDFQLYGGAVTVEAPVEGWTNEAANANLAERDVRARVLAIESVDEERVYVEAAMGMSTGQGEARSGQLVASLYTVRDGLIFRVELSADVAAVRRRAGLPPAAL